MAQAPGYEKLMALDRRVPIMPTPARWARSSQTDRRARGASTSSASISAGRPPTSSGVRRATSSTARSAPTSGMSYSVSNVLAEAGLDNVMRWVPFDMDEARPAQPDQEQDDPADDDSADARGADDRAGHRPRGPAPGLRAAQVARGRAQGRAAGAHDRRCLRADRLAARRWST